MSRRAWLTPDNVGGAQCIPVFIPAGEEHRAVLLGLLLDLLREQNWEQYGTATPEDTAAAYFEQYVKTVEGGICMPVGSVFWRASANVPNGAVEANGQSLLRADYPALFAEIGTTYGAADGTHFNVPDLEDNFVVGTGSYSLGDTGGETHHQLVENEMPYHNHSIQRTVNVPVQSGAGAFVKGVSLGDAVTGNTGGSAQHENRPPYIALKPFIVAV